MSEVSPSPHDRLAALPSPELVSDGGQGVEAMVDQLDRDYAADEIRRRFDFVVARLTRSQHELFLLMAAGLTREQIAEELRIDRSTLSHRESALIRRVKILMTRANRDRAGMRQSTVRCRGQKTGGMETGGRRGPEALTRDMTGS